MITIGGVWLGVTALTVVTSVWNGFEAEFLSKLLGINAHAIVLRNLDVFRDYEAISTGLEEEPQISIVNPFVYSEVIVRSPKGTAGVAIKGVDARHAKKTPLKQYLPANAFKRFQESTTSTNTLPGIFVGKDLQETLHVNIGDRVSVISPYGGEDGQPKSRPFEVAGVFHSGMYEFDARMVFVPLSTAQDFFKLYNTVTGLEVWTHDSTTSFMTVRNAIKASLQDRLSVDKNKNGKYDQEDGDTFEDRNHNDKFDPENENDPYAYEVRDWSQTNRSTFGAVQQQKQMISIVLGFIILVAAFNIVATLILLILEKSREIAVLKSMGASNRSILTIFVIDGQIIGALGCIFGVTTGLIVCALLEAYGLKLDPRVYFLENLPIVIRPIEILFVAGGAMFAATVATMYPAYRAANLSPVDGLREGHLPAAEFTESAH
jgi:lipoprotein-releasing system permease protein